MRLGGHALNPPPPPLGELKQFVLTADENAIQQVMPVLSSDVISCLVKINEQ